MCRDSSAALPPSWITASSNKMVSPMAAPPIHSATAKHGDLMNCHTVMLVKHPVTSVTDNVLGGQTGGYEKKGKYAQHTHQICFTKVNYNLCTQILYISPLTKITNNLAFEPINSSMQDTLPEAPRVYLHIYIWQIKRRKVKQM